MERHPIADRARKEYLRTATIMEQEPWYLVRAARALRDWIDMNDNKSWPDPIMPVWMHERATRPIGVQPNPTGWEKFAPGPVRLIHAEGIPPQEPKPKKRPAKETGEPKKRGRPRKVRPEENTDPQPEVETAPAPLGDMAIDAPEVEAVPEDGGVREDQAQVGEDQAEVGKDQAEVGEGEKPGEAKDLPAPDVSLYGCPRCYHSPSGCSTCKRPGYKARGPNIRTTGKAKAKAASKSKAAAKGSKGPGRGRKPGRSARQKS
ncbi:unnamed protein product [Cladocopium goreaui]|uniref:Uncharacterized protein n=1 Tax=Cladocopium goreaui TaxID=2562237 RepID=A0A9P1GGJ8_9DINO|nr:unnamed protein product [Cladocopium goreaui]